MSAVRMTFLYPQFFRSIRSSEPLVQTVRHRQQRPPNQSRSSFSTSSRRNQQFAQRHGKAVGPFLPPGETVEDAKVLVAENEKKAINTPIPRRELQLPKPKATPSTAPLPQETQEAAKPPSNAETATPKTAAESKPAAEPSATTKVTPLQQAAINTASPSTITPIERVMQIAEPVETPLIDPEIPHMHAPPYVHHFDSYTLCKGVEQGGFSEKQAITAMKAVRSLLAFNLDIAKLGLVSKGDVENESYLFRAACSELRTEIQNNHRADEEKMRSERTILQHEVDVLAQKMAADLLTLKDDLKGMFDDRRMTVRMDQRHMESEIQQLNYKIQVALNSDSKSEVESLRWHLARRSVFAIIFMTLMVLSSLRYASYRTHEEEMERARIEKLAAQQASNKLHHRGTDGDKQTGEDLPAGLVAEVLSAG